MARTSNRIENFGQLRLLTHEDLEQGWIKILTLYRDSFPKGSVEWKKANQSVINHVAIGKHHFRTTLGIFWDNPNVFMELLAGEKLARRKYLFSVTKDGCWDAFYISVEDEEDGKTGPFQEGYERHIFPFTTEKICQLIAKVAEALSPQMVVENQETLHLGFPIVGNEEDWRLMILCGPYLQFSFDTKGIDDLTKFVNALAKRMSRWWGEINAVQV